MIISRFSGTVALSGQAIGLVRTIPGTQFIMTLDIPNHITHGDLKAKLELTTILCLDGSTQSTIVLSTHKASQQNIQAAVESVNVLSDFLGRR
jgi:hypothetical protein